MAGQIVPQKDEAPIEMRQVLQREYLLHISREITAALDLPTLLQKVLQYAVELLSGQAGIIALRRPHGDFFVHTSVGLPPSTLPSLTPFLDQLPTNLKEAKAQDWRIPDAREHLEEVSEATGLELSHAVGMPLLLAERFFGMVFVFRTTGAALFSDVDKALLQAFADQAAIAIDNARLYSQMTFRAQSLSKLYQAGLALAQQTTDLDATLRQVARLARDSVGADGAAILMRDADGFNVSVAEGILDQATLENALSEPELQAMLSQSEPWIVSDTSEESHVAPLAKRNMASGVCVPIALGQEHPGSMLLVARQPHTFHSQDMALLNTFANQAALAIRNARIYHDLSVEHQRLAAILAQTADGILILDSEHRVRDFNAAFSSMSGWPPDHARGQPGSSIIRLTSQHDAPVPLPFLEAAHFDAPFSSIEGYLIRRDGSRGPYASVSIAPLRQDGDRIVGAVVSVHDLSAFRQAEELKSTFLSVISHELKTPVALIKGFAETLSREDGTPAPETVREFGQIIADESDRLTHLIDNLLTTARAEAGGISLAIVPEVPLPRLAEHAAAAFREQTQSHTIEVDFPEDFPLIEADPHWLREVLDNLIANAIKYSPRGGRILVTGWYDDTHVHVAVSDEGLGLSPEEQKRIFERFYRAPDKRALAKGAGLGLYLCKAVIEAHGGQISVNSKEGKGATFTFSLPVKSPRREAAHE